MKERSITDLATVSSVLGVWFELGFKYRAIVRYATGYGEADGLASRVFDLQEWDDTRRRWGACDIKAGLVAREAFRRWASSEGFPETIALPEIALPERVMA